MAYSKALYRKDIDGTAIGTGGKTHPEVPMKRKSYQFPCPLTLSFAKIPRSLVKKLRIMIVNATFYLSQIECCN